MLTGRVDVPFSRGYPPYGRTFIQHVRCIIAGLVGFHEIETALHVQQVEQRKSRVDFVLYFTKLRPACAQSL